MIEHINSCWKAQTPLHTSPGGGKPLNSMEHFSSCWQAQSAIVEKMVQNHKVHKSSKYTPLIEHINSSWEVRKSLSTSAVAGKPSQAF